LLNDESLLVLFVLVRLGKYLFLYFVLHL